MGFLPNRDINDIKKEMKQWILERGDEWLKEHFDLRFDKLHNAAFEVEPGHPFVKCMRSVSSAAGVSDDIQGWIVSCDARLFPRVAKMPVITVGPGRLVDAHSIGEHVDINEIIKTAKLYALTALDWCGV